MSPLHSIHAVAHEEPISLLPLYVRVVRPAYLWDTRGIVYGLAGVWGRARA